MVARRDATARLLGRLRARARFAMSRSWRSVQVCLTIWSYCMVWPTPGRHWLSTRIR